MVFLYNSMSSSFNLKVEIIRCEDLKPEVRRNHGLPSRGLAIKKIKKNSPLVISYEKIEGNFINFVTSKLGKCNMIPLVKAFREKYG